MLINYFLQNDIMCLLYYYECDHTLLHDTSIGGADVAYQTIGGTDVVDPPRLWLVPQACCLSACCSATLSLGAVLMRIALFVTMSVWWTLFTRCSAKVFIAQELNFEQNVHITKSVQSVRSDSVGYVAIDVIFDSIILVPSSVRFSSRVCVTLITCMNWIEL
jgi:hypothetical protein